MAGIEAVTDFGNYQDVRFTGDAQAFLSALASRTAIRHFEITKPSLNDIFIRIAKPSDRHVAVTAGAD